jgi:hypothetical protein
MQLFAAAPHGGKQVSRLQQIQVLRHTLPRHVKVFTQLVESAAVVRMQQIEQLSPAGIGEGPEKRVGVVALRHILYASDYLPNDRQVVPCMSSICALRAVALGSTSYLYAGADCGGERAAAIYSLIVMAKLDELALEAYFRYLHEQIADHFI